MYKYGTGTDEYIIIQRSSESIMKHANYVKNK